MRYSLILLTAATIVVAFPDIAEEPRTLSKTLESSNSQAGDVFGFSSILHARSPTRNKGKARGKAPATKESIAERFRKSAEISNSPRHAAQHQDSSRRSSSPAASSGAGISANIRKATDEKSPERAQVKSPVASGLSSILGGPSQPPKESTSGTSRRLSVSVPDSPRSPSKPATRKSARASRIETPAQHRESPRGPSPLPEIGSSRPRIRRQKGSPSAADLRESSASSQGSPKSPVGRKSEKVWDISHTTIQGSGERLREGTGGANSPTEVTPTPSPPDRSRSTSPIDRSRASSPRFQLWLAGAKQVLKESHILKPEDKRPNAAMIDTATRARAAAKIRRATARRKLSDAQKQLYGGRAMSPTTQRMVVHSSSSSNAAVDATKANADAHSEAGHALIHTNQNHRVPEYFATGAREFRHKFSLETHRNAFWSEYQARLSKEEADQLSPHNPDRGAAYGRAATAKKRAMKHAEEYYKHRDRYVVTKEELGDSSGSSTDGEQELKDAPRRKPE